MYNLSYSQMEKITDFFKKFVQEENINSSLILGIDSVGCVVEMDIESLLEDTDVDVLKAELEEVEEENDKLGDEIIDLKSDIKELEKEKEEFKREIKYLRETLDNIKSYAKFIAEEVE